MPWGSVPPVRFPELLYSFSLLQVFTPASAALFITAGVGLFFYFRYEKQRLIEERGGFCLREGLLIDLSRKGESSKVIWQATDRRAFLSFDT